MKRRPAGRLLAWGRRLTETGARPTQRFVWCVAALALPALASITLPAAVWAVWLGLAGLFAAFVADAIAAGARVHNLRAAVEAPRAAGRGLVFPLEIAVHNENAEAVRGELRIVIPHILNVAPAAAPATGGTRAAVGTGAPGEPGWWCEPLRLAPGETVRYLAEATSPRRGLRTVGPCWARVAGPWGLAERRRELEGTAAVKILPESLASSESFREMRGMLHAPDSKEKSRRRGEGMEFESLTPYQYGDEERHIDWRATARSRRLMVRRFQLELNREIFVVLDCGRLMGADVDGAVKMDRAVDAGLALCKTAIHRGDKCGVAIYDSAVRGFLPPQVGPAGFRAILEQVYDVGHTNRESDFAALFAQFQSRQRKRAMVVVLSDIVDDQGSLALRTALFHMAKRHLVLFAALRTPMLERILSEETTSYSDMARQAVAGRLLRERQRGLHLLRRAGVHVVDVAPHELTVSLVNEYVSLREAGRL